MSPLEILEWTMGWAWPVLIVLSILMAWGIVRVIGWDEQDLQEPATCPDPGRHSVCQCD